MPDNNDMDDKAADAAVEDIGANMEESHTTEDKTEEKANIQTDTDVNKNKGTDKELHHQALDLIGTVLSDDYKGDKKKFFEDHPKLAEKANKSVRYKQAYRNLTDKGQEDDDDTIDEEELAERFSEKVYTKVTSKAQAEERKTQTKEFAVKEGINKDDIDALNKAAEALQKATGEPFAKCLEGAKQTLKGSLKPKSPLNMPSGEGMNKEGDNNESKITALMEKHGVSRKQAETYVKNSKGYDGSLDKWVSH